MKKFNLLIVASLVLSGCTNNMLQKLSTVGEPPQLSHIKNPTEMNGYQPVTMPMPTPRTDSITCHGNSIWQNGSKAFFKDQRANKVGDILTVLVDLNQKETMEMNPNLSRKTQGNTIVNNILGFERKAEKLFPKKQHPDGQKNSKWLDFSSDPSLSGNAKYDVTDKINFKIAVTVVQILPNGNMVIHGRSEIRLINEVREVELKGIVRKEDISAGNFITYDKIAEVRISYGGRGELTDMQAFPWGQQILNKVMPF